MHNFLHHSVLCHYRRSIRRLSVKRLSRCFVHGNKTEKDKLRSVYGQENLDAHQSMFSTTERFLFFFSPYLAGRATIQRVLVTRCTSCYKHYMFPIILLLSPRVKHNLQQIEMKAKNEEFFFDPLCVEFGFIYIPQKYTTNIRDFLIRSI